MRKNGASETSISDRRRPAFNVQAELEKLIPAPFLALAGLGLALTIAAPPAAVAAKEKITGRLIVEDVLARPGTSVTLKARLVEEGLLGVKGLGGETIAFAVRDRHAGTALTGGDGRAFLQFTTHMRGNHPIVATVASGPRVAPAEGAGNLASWERRRPILLVDVVTLAQRPAPVVNPLPDLPLPALPFAASRTPLGPPRDEARHALVKLAEFYYNVLYLHDGDTARHETRDWLRRHGFPVGIARAVPQTAEALLALMEELKTGGWDNLEAGIGRTRDFAQTLVKQRLKTVIFPDPMEKNPYPRRARLVRAWDEVRQHL